MKRCSVCFEDKVLSQDFYKDSRQKDGYFACCKSCHNKRNAKSMSKNKEKTYAYQKEWRKNNPEKVRIGRKRSAEKRKEANRVYHREYRLRNLEYHREKGREDQKRRRTENLEEVRKIDRINYRKNKLYACMSSNIYRALKLNKNGRSWEELVGYTLGELKKHLESLFVEGMSWENYGSAWHVDHKKPKSLFRVAEFEECWNIKNLQPLWARENIIKGNRYKEV